MAPFRPNLIFSVELPGGQDRLRQMILYVASKCQNATRFGGIKLNKILWRADFESFAKRGIPVTGRAYQRLRLGPAPKEMLPLHREMIERGLIEIKIFDFGDDVIERRTIPLIDPDLSRFDQMDIDFVDNSIVYYWYLTGMETSDDSHGLAWRSRVDQDPMPYQLAYIADRRLRRSQRLDLEKLAANRGWMSE